MTINQIIKEYLIKQLEQSFPYLNYDINPIIKNNDIVGFIAANKIQNDKCIMATYCIDAYKDILEKSINEFYESFKPKYISCSLYDKETLKLYKKMFNLKKVMEQDFINIYIIVNKM